LVIILKTKPVSGLSILEEIIEEIKSSGQKILSGESVFKMYDTYGFPLELTEINEVGDKRAQTIKVELERIKNKALVQRY